MLWGRQDRNERISPAPMPSMQPRALCCSKSYKRCWMSRTQSKPSDAADACGSDWPADRNGTGPLARAMQEKRIARGQTNAASKRRAARESEPSARARKGWRARRLRAFSALLCAKVRPPIAMRRFDTH
jgi:hypothetical protein